MNDIDTQISDDLQSLAGDSRRGIGDFADVSALLSRGPAYRDERAGVEARRDALWRRRQLELALMPLSLERVFVHRISRAAAGGAAAFAALAILVGLSQPALVYFTDLVVPGRLTLTLVGVVSVAFILAAYIAGGWLAERAFERAVGDTLAGTGDPHGDLDALASGPIDAARALARRADGWSIGLLLLGFATLAPVMAYLSLVSMGMAMRPFHSIGEVAVLIVGSGDLLLLAIGMAVGATMALAAGRACAREHRSVERPRLLSILGHPVVLPVVLGGLLALLAVMGSAFLKFRMGVYVSESSRLMLSVGGTLCIVAATAWALLWHRRREQRRLELSTS